MPDSTADSTICFHCRCPGADTRGAKGELYHEDCLPDQGGHDTDTSDVVSCPDCDLSFTVDALDVSPSELRYCPECRHSLEKPTIPLVA